MEEAPESLDRSLSEPAIVPCLWVTGVGTEIHGEILRIVGWVDLPDFGGETKERRIVVRFALPVAAAAAGLTEVLAIRSQSGRKRSARDH